MWSLVKFASLAFLLAASAAYPQDFDTGQRAYDAGAYATALDNWKPLAEQGDVDAQYALGVMYQNVNGVLKDDTATLRWYRMAAEQGHAKSQYALGNMYASGMGVLVDDAAAVHWYHKAAVQGNVDAQYALGADYSFGKGIPRNYVAAYMWLNIAGANGSQNARELRSIFESRMSQADITKAQQKSNLCVQSNYNNCD